MGWPPELVKRLEPQLRRTQPLGWPLPLEQLQRVGDSVMADRGNGQPHKGLDLYAPAGTAVRSASAGTVLRVQDGRSSTRERSRRAGLFVDVRGPEGYVYRYLHLADTPVQAGERLRPGALLGTLAASGTPDLQRTGPHLHFEIRRSDVSGPARDYGPPLDPLRLLPPRDRA
jgi:murein DD-endopeptidase MepM/ murein hydrolase activator NlpD